MDLRLDVTLSVRLGRSGATHLQPRHLLTGIERAARVDRADHRVVPARRDEVPTARVAVGRVDRVVLVEGLDAPLVAFPPPI